MAMWNLTKKQIDDHERLCFTGCHVMLRKHEQADPNDPNSAYWNPSMDKYVGSITPVTAVLSRDNWGYLLITVAIDKGKNNWRAVSMDNVTAQIGAPTASNAKLAGSVSTPSPVVVDRAGVGNAWDPPLPLPNHRKELESAPKDRMERTLGDCLAEHQRKKIRELNKIAEERENYNPYV